MDFKFGEDCAKFPIRDILAVSLCHLHSANSVKARGISADGYQSIPDGKGYGRRSFSIQTVELNIVAQGI
jgi:hypothetical protein